MEVSWVDLVAVGAYFVIVLGVGFYATCRANTSTTQGYFLAGQSSNWFLIGTSTFATNIGAPMFVGLAGSAANSGISVVMFEWHAMIMLVALGWIFLPVYRASGCYTMPQYLKLRYGGRRIRVLLAIITLIVDIIGQIAGQMYAGALFIQEIFKWNLYAAVLFILALTAIYTVIGGLTAVLWTDAIQTFILIIGSIILSVIGLYRVGGWEGISQQYPLAAANYTYLDYSLYGNRSCGLPRADWNHIFRAPDADYPWPGMVFGLTIMATNAWCTSQLCVQRSLSARSITQAKVGLLLAAYLKILPFLFFIIPGMISRILFPYEVACADPDICRSYCRNPSGCSNLAYPFLVVRILPTGVRGIMLAALLAALMSSLTSIFNSSSTVFTIDIYKRFRRKAKDRELMIVGRVYILILVGVSIVWLPIVERIQGSQFWDFFSSINSYTLAPTIAAFYLGIFVPRTTETGAFLGMLTGFAIGVVRMVLTWVQLPPPCGDPGPDRRSPLISKVHFFHFAIINFSISCFIMICISLLTQPRLPSQLRRVTFWTKHDPLPQEVVDSDDEENVEEEDGDQKNPPEDPGKETCSKKFLRYLCGIENRPKPKLTKEQVLEMQRKSTNIKEDPFWRRVLDINAVLALSVCVFLHAFFA